MQHSTGGVGEFFRGNSKDFCKYCSLNFRFASDQIQVDSLDFSVIKPLELLTDKEIPDVLVSSIYWFDPRRESFHNLFYQRTT